MVIALADCEKKDLIAVRSGAFVVISVNNLVYAYKFDNNLETARLIFFLNLVISSLIINLYGLQVSMSLKTYKAIKLGIECTNFSYQILCLQMSVLIIHGYWFQVSYARAQLKQKNSFALNKKN